MEGPLLLLNLFISSFLCILSCNALLKTDFPSDFTFGVASSAYQYEGAVAEGGKGHSIWDTFSHIPGKIIDGTNADVSVDHYHRYKEDIELMTDLGVSAFRLSISWSRILPNGSGPVNDEAVRHYNDVIDELLTKGIEPYVTLYHFDVPQALEDAHGSWLSPRMVDDFALFAETCFRAFGDRVKHWITLNEPRLYANFAYNLGILAPGRCSPDVGTCSEGDSSVEPYKVVHHFLLSHAVAVQIYNQKFKAKQGGSIGITIVPVWFEPFSNASADIAAAKRALEFSLAWMMDPLVYGDYSPLLRSLVKDKLPSFTSGQRRMLRNSFDFIGINHYQSLYAADYTNMKPAFKPDVLQQGYYKDTKASATWIKEGISIGPRGIRLLLNYIRQRYGNPLISITENGFPDATSDPKEELSDQMRVEYLRSYLSSIAAAIRDGCNVRGYFVWSLMDTWEWANGKLFRYGLYHVDYENNLTRIPKESALWYKQFLQTPNTFSS